MGDLCMCGHEEREHVEMCVAFIGDWHAGTRAPCECAEYRRSPLSAFRGPAVTFTREEAAGWLDGLGFRYAAGAARFGDLRRRRASMHELLGCARYDLACGSAYRHENAELQLLAARILRAVRP